ncbi:MAG: radical SAM protein [Methanobacteriota archaeon]|nr:MAG: radical SAM protein [Euryarchaeota archaeon]
MRVIAEYGRDDLAKVYVARMREAETDKQAKGEYMIEFVESLQPPNPRERKWVLIVSSMFGCPIRCKMCDAGGNYSGKMTAEEIVSQVDYVVRRRYPDGKVPSDKFKVQFARMGEPTLNPAVLDALRMLPKMFDAPGLYASLSTVAPKQGGAPDVLDRLIEVKNDCYANGRFQLQFSIHTTDEDKRDEMIPSKKLSLEEIANYCERFIDLEAGDKKVTLNFAPAEGYPIDVAVVRRHFNPAKFIIKLTPLNPTVRSREESLISIIDPHIDDPSRGLVEEFGRNGYDVILSIGELEENRIGSNCGQFIQRAIQAEERPRESYELDRYQVNCDAAK